MTEQDQKAQPETQEQKSILPEDLTEYEKMLVERWRARGMSEEDILETLLTT